MRLFKGLKLIGIFGNNDGYKFILTKAFGEIGGEMKGDFGVIEAGDLKSPQAISSVSVKIALYHGEFKEISEALVKSGDYDAVFTGHWHKTEIKKIGKTVWLSLGSAQRFFAENQKPVVGIFKIETKKIEIVHLK